ncbi:hypothetical protein CKM354_000450000 [Cercospora kikuchii]|uniref:2EXR domain-containing protein n=1 Tax=Cercospora kikuchii TaxID=84275 RepID=A0A9P3CK06_9PEZI|nr:uncharacterized protein CKM354_000450000 [Cercospora kikuchii]GIZ41185.1 hypothetical protein CKM354_000450000 [Cercospora kikuchii]
MTGFLDLPAELRNRVYELLIAHNQLITLSRTVGQANKSPYQQNGPAYQDHEAVLPRLPALAAVNQQVRTESLAIFYGSNTFTSHTVTCTHVFLKNLDKQSLTLLRDVRCTTYQISAVQQILIPKLTKLVEVYGKGYLSAHAAKVPLRTKRVGTGGSDENFEVSWVSLAELGVWERDPRDIDMVRKRTLLSGY